MNLDQFSYEDNDRRYIKPEVSLGEQNAFIQNLRDTQGERNAQIQQSTQDLGTAVPSNLGGLTGSEAYFNARYQTPQTNATVANLKATAQAQALNTVLNNELEKAKKLYNDAYRAAKARGNSNGSGGNGGNGNNGNTSGWDGEIDVNPTDDDEEDEEEKEEEKETPPNKKDYYQTPQEKNEQLEKDTGVPSMWWNILRIFG